ncbi:protein ripply1 [Ambystoma mexicanum]|uniref:protein ripply1 n=1 Tax=Ambystoma mexicanum TaxID=8296 RepID=UPI0037E862F5
MDAAVVCVKRQLPQGALAWASGRRCNPNHRTPAEGQHRRDSDAPFWRPWVASATDTASQRRKLDQSPYRRRTGCDGAEGVGALPFFKHPVRLLWPKSKSFDYLYSDGEMLLKDFPAQATINFYDDSDSEDEDEEELEEEELVKESSPLGFNRHPSAALNVSSTHSCLN